MENKQFESPAAWRPEVGKTAWCKVMPPGEIHELQIHEDCSYKYHLRSKEEYCYSVSKAGQAKFELWSNHLFPTAEAALASIKVYDLNGEEVPRDQPVPGNRETLGPTTEIFHSMPEMVERMGELSKVEDIHFMSYECPKYSGRYALTWVTDGGLELVRQEMTAANPPKLIGTRNPTNDRATLADHGITYNDERKDEGGC